MKKIKHMTKQRKVLRTVADVIAAYRGTAACARHWDVGMAAVSNWRTEGIPPGYHLRIVRELEARGLIVDERALGWV